MSFPIKNGGSFHSYVNVYQRVETILTHISIPWVFSCFRPRACQMFRQAIDGTDGPFTVGAPGTISAPWTKYHWIALRENLNRRPWVFTIKYRIYRVFRLKLSHHPILWKYGWCGRKKYGIKIQKDCVKIMCFSENDGYNLGLASHDVE